MGNTRPRKVIAVNIETGDKVEFRSEYDCARVFGVSAPAIQQAKAHMGSCKGWRIFDTPDRIREKIQELEEQIKMLEG